jgi:hypothetical protein
MSHLPNSITGSTAAAWDALQKNDWELALRIVASIDFQLSDLDHLRLLCSIYIQAERWDDVAQLSAVATQSFPEQPIFWEINAWTEYIRGHVSAALFILNNLTIRFPHRESSEFLLAYIQSAAAGNVAEANHWLMAASQFSMNKEAYRLPTCAQPEIRRFFATEELFFPT